MRTVTMRAVEIDANPQMDDMPEGSRHFRCYLRCEGRRMVIRYSQGPGIPHDPRTADVLDCILSDASGYQGSRSFEDWCADYGYDTDSRKAERTYRAVERQTKALLRLLGVSSVFDAIGDQDTETAATALAGAR